jgi:hypothetical protein
MTYDQAKQIRDTLDAAAKAASERLNAFPKTGPMGLTPDSVKSSPAYRRAKADFDTAFRRLQNFNVQFTRAFKAEIRAERQRKFAS